MKSNPQIDFYRTSAIHSVLKRYEFTEDEKKVIQAAIRTASTKYPNMNLIVKADALLKEITASRPPVEEKLDEADLAKAKARIAMIDAKTKQVNAEEGSKGLGALILAFVVPAAILIFVSRQYFNSDDISKKTSSAPSMLSFNEAQAFCKGRGKVLPLTFEDDSNKLHIPDEYNQKGYWRSNGGVIYNLYRGKITDKPDGEKHYALCVDENGKNYPVTYNSTP